MHTDVPSPLLHASVTPCLPSARSLAATRHSAEGKSRQSRGGSPCLDRSAIRPIASRPPPPRSFSPRWRRPPRRPSSQPCSPVMPSCPPPVSWRRRAMRRTASSCSGKYTTPDGRRQDAPGSVRGTSFLSDRAAPRPTGLSLPFAAGQPVQGFSGIKTAKDGTYWVLTDNGFGNKRNSPDAHARCSTACGSTGPAAPSTGWRRSSCAIRIGSSRSTS